MARYGQAFDFLEQAQIGLEEEGSVSFYTAEIYRLLGDGSSGALTKI